MRTSSTATCSRRTPRLPCLGVMVAVALALSCAPAAGAADFPRAQLAADTQRVSATLDDYFGDSTALELAQALGGSAARQSLLIGLAGVSSALDDPALADVQWTRADAIAERRADSTARLMILAGTLQTALALGDYQRCLDVAGNVRRLASALGDERSEATAENAIGVVERRRGNLDSALLHQQRALQLERAAGNRVGEGMVLGDLGTLYRDRGDFARALDAGLEAVQLRERSGDRLEIAYRNVALLYRELEDETTARDYFHRALDTAAKRGVPSTYSSVIGAYASLLNDLGEYAAAEQAAQEALAIDSALGDRPHQGLEHLELGRALLGQQQFDAAGDHLERALRLGRELGQREIAARALLHITEIALAHHELLRAHGLIDEAVAGLEQARLRPQLAQAYALRELLARAEHDDATALRFAHKYSAAREELLGIRASRQLAALEARHARSEAEQRVALLAKDNELQAARIEAQQLQRLFYAAAVLGLALSLIALIGRHRGVRRLNRALGDANVRLGEQAAALYHAATTDWLTHTDNRRHLLEQLGARIVECVRDGRELALMVIDFDHFKQINDARGHPFGDRVLVAGARIMRECLGPGDLLGRFGGEEFVAVACDRDPAAVMALAERIRSRVAEQMAALVPELRTMATISIGVARIAELSVPASTDSLLEAADLALYAAKSDGRNRVRRYAA